MSKSLKNFITIRKSLEKYSARQIRIMFLLQPWANPMNFSDQTVEDARVKEKTFRAFFDDVEAYSRNPKFTNNYIWTKTIKIASY